MKIAIISFTGKGHELNRRLLRILRGSGDEAEGFAAGASGKERGEDLAAAGNVSELTGRLFSERGAIIFVGAAGIAVRMCAPYIRDKYTDPAVLAVDEGARFVIPLLSGHIGGANALAKRIARALGALPAVTTATDVSGVFSVDVWAKDSGLLIGNREAAKRVSAALLEGRTVWFRSDLPVLGRLPKGLVPEENAADKSGAGIVVSAFRPPEKGALNLVPRVLCLGVGCKKNAAPETVLAAFETFAKSHNIAPGAFGFVASIDIKQDEPAVLSLAERLGAETRFFTSEELSKAPGAYAASEFVLEHTGTDNVCGRASRLVFERELFPKEIVSGVTFAVSAEEKYLSFPENESGGARLILVTGGAYQGKHAFAGRLKEEAEASGRALRVLDGLQESLERLAGDPRGEDEIAAEIAAGIAREVSRGSAGEASRGSAGEVSRGSGGVIVIIPEVGCGIVPVSRTDRRLRELTGRTASALAGMADEVWRVQCGIPQRLK